VTQALTLGLSTHDDAELKTALRAKPDYVALGPIFPTTLEIDALLRRRALQDHRMEEARRQHSLVRSAASSSNRPRKNFRAGADSIAVVSDYPERRPRRAGTRLARAKRGGRMR